MSHNFATALQPYYQRQGNRIVFSNGQNLNQLALSMWEKLGYKGVDASIISRVINGERLFTYNQLVSFCTILNLSNSQQIELQQALFSDLLARQGFEDSFADSQSFPTRSTLLTQRYVEQIIDNDTDGEGSFKYWSEMHKSFWRAEFENLLPELELGLTHIRRQKLTATPKGRLWLGAIYATQADVYTHLLSPDFLVAHPYFAKRKLEYYLHQIGPNSPYLPHIVMPIGALLRSTADNLFRRSKSKKVALELLIQAYQLRYTILKNLDRHHPLIVALTGELMLNTAYLELYFPQSAANTIATGYQFFDLLELARVSSNLAQHPYVKVHEPLIDDYLGRIAIRQHELNNSSTKKLEAAQVNIISAQKRASQLNSVTRITEINLAVTKIELYYALGIAIPKSDMIAGLRLVRHSGDVKQSNRLLSYLNH